MDTIYLFMVVVFLRTLLYFINKYWVLNGISNWSWAVVNLSFIVLATCLLIFLKEGTTKNYPINMLVVIFSIFYFSLLIGRYGKQRKN